MFKKVGRTIAVLIVTFAFLSLLFQTTAAYDPPWAHIGDFVWEDFNMNGLQDDGDTGISGVNVTLYDSADNKLASQLTNATGGYLFPGRAQGLYYVVFKAPAGYVFSPQDQGSDDTFDSDADSTGKTATAYVPTINRTFDAGLYQVATIGDFVWEDLNMNGIQDDGATGISGVTVNLYDSGNNNVASTTTDGAGGYLFSGLVPGDYYVGFVAPAGYFLSPQDQGADDNLDSDADPVTGMTALTTLTYGETDLTWDAGLYQEAPPNGPGVGTQGYWKNHPEAWPVDEITIGGVTYSKDEAIALMDAGNDKTYNMFSQLVAAKLNVLIGNDDSCIADTLSAADAWMAANPVGSGVEANSDEWDEGEPLKDILDDYNNGLLCAPPRD